MTMAGDGTSKPLCHQWLLLLRSATKNCLASRAGTKRIHYKFPDGREMLEDWKVEPGKARELLGRYWKRKTIVGKELSWEVEVGENVQVEVQQKERSLSDIQPLTIRESNSNPAVSSRTTAGCYEWRIRNLPAPGDNYGVTLEPDTYSLVVSTRNKKYYKKLIVPELKRLQLNLKPECILTSFANRTFIIQYKKPIEIIELEKTIWQEIISPLKAENSENPSGCSQA